MRSLVVLTALLTLTLAVVGCSKASGEKQATKQVLKPTTKAPLQIQPHQSFYGVYIMGHKSGYATEILENSTYKGVKAFSYRMNASLKVKRMGMTIAMEMKSIRYYQATPPYKLLALEDNLGTTGTTLKIKGYYIGKDFYLLKGSEYKPKAQPLETFLDIYHVDRIPKLKDGDAFKTVRFDTQMDENIHISNKVLSVKETMLQGRMMKVLQIQSDEEETGITMKSKITEQGTLLEGFLGAQFKMVKEPEKIAKDPGVSLPDIYEQSAIIATGVTIVDPRRVNKAVFKICGIQPDLLKNFDQQVIPGSDGCFKLSVDRSKHGALSLDKEIKDQKIYKEEFLKSDERITSTAPEIKAQATAIKKECGSPAKLHVCLMEWVHKAVSYTLNYNPFNAGAVLKEKRGDCSEMSLLFVALARALGLPAREVNGIVFAGSSPLSFGYHAWVEVLLDDAWVPVDPTWNEFPVDATHIKINISNPYEIFKVFGKISLEVVSVN